MKQALESAFKKALRPIIRVVLRNGMTHKEISQLCKQICVDVAAEDFGISGRPTNISRIAIITGLDRKEVKRIKDFLQDDKLVEQAQKEQNRLTRVLSAWHQEKDFLDNNNKPKDLPIYGVKGSFEQLAKSFGGDLPVSALLKELLKGSAVEKIENSKVRVLKRHFSINQASPESVMRMGSVLNDLGATIFNNIYPEDANKKNSGLLFERRASNSDIPISMVPEFKKILEESGQNFLEKVDAWLSEHEAIVRQGKNTGKEKNVRLGVGMYHIQSDAENEK